MNFHGNKLSDTRNLLQMLTKSTSPSYLPRSWPWSRAEYISVTSSLKLGHCKQLRSLAFRIVPEPSHTLGRTRNKRRVAVQGLSSEVPLFGDVNCSCQHSERPQPGSGSCSGCPSLSPGAAHHLTSLPGTEAAAGKAALRKELSSPKTRVEHQGRSSRGAG